MYCSFSLHTVLIVVPLSDRCYLAFGNHIVRITDRYTTIPVEECTTPKMVLLFQAPIVVSHVTNALFVSRVIQWLLVRREMKERSLVIQK